MRPLETTPDRPDGPEVRATSAGRGTLRGETLFALTAVRMVAVLGVESFFNVVRALLFVFVAPAYRRRVRRIVLGASRPSAIAAVLLGLALAACAPEPMRVDEPTGDSRSFKGQMQELRWSIRAMADQSDSKESLEQDLKNLATEPNWKEELRWDAENLFLMPDAQKSLEWDLQALGDPDFKRHGLKETVELLGW